MVTRVATTPSTTVALREPLGGVCHDLIIERRPAGRPGSKVRMRPTGADAAVDPGRGLRGGPWTRLSTGEVRHEFDRADTGRRWLSGCAWSHRTPGGGRVARGGVPVAAPVAAALGPRSTCSSSGSSATPRPELGVGAIEGGGSGPGPLGSSPASASTPSRCGGRSRPRGREAQPAGGWYRGDRPRLSVTDQAVILVDDGLATGSTARAAIDVLRQSGAGRIILAVPVAPPETVRAVAPRRGGVPGDPRSPRIDRRVVRGFDG